MSTESREDEGLIVETKPQKIQSRFLVVGVCISTQLSFSGWHVLGGVALSGSKAVDPYVFALYREAGASILMGLAAFCLEGYAATMAPGHLFVQCLHLSPSKKKENNKIAILLLAAGLFSFGNVFLTVIALTMIPSDIYSMYQPTIPVFTTAIAVLSGFETKLNRTICLGIATSVIGAIIVELSAAEEGSSATGSFFGNILTLIQCLSISSLIVITKPLTKLYSPLIITAWYYTIGSLWTLLALLIAERPLSAFFWTMPEPWIALVYAILIATFYAYEAYSWLIHHASPTLVAAFCPLQPVFTVLLNFLILAKGLGLNTALAGFVVISGLFITVYGKRSDFYRSAASSSPSIPPEEEQSTLNDSLLPPPSSQSDTNDTSPPV